MAEDYYSATPTSEAKSDPIQSNPPPSQGWKSSEFKIVAVITLLGALVTFNVIPETHWSGRLVAAILTTASALGYTAIRTRAKRATP